MIKFLLRKLGFLAPKVEMSNTDVNSTSVTHNLAAETPAIEEVKVVETTTPTKRGRKPRQNGAGKTSKKPKVN